MNKLKRVLAIGLAAVMMISMAACSNTKEDGSEEGGKGGKGGKVSSDRSLAKQYVFRYQDLDVTSGNDTNIQAFRRDGDTLEFLTMSYNWDSSGESQTMSYVTMKSDGSDVKTIMIDLPKANSQGPNYGEDGEMQLFEGIGPMGEPVRPDPIAVDPDLGDYDYEPSDYAYENYYFSNACLSNDSIYALCNHWKESFSNGAYDSVSENIIYCWDKKDGSVIFSVPFDMSKYQNEDSYSYISQMISMKSGQLGIIMTGDQSGIITVDKDGSVSSLKKVNADKDIFSKDPTFAEKSDGTMLVAYYSDDWNKMFLRTFDPSNLSFGQEYEVPKEARNSGFYNFTTSSDKDIIYSNSEGVFAFNLGDAEVTKIMDYVNSDLATYSLDNLSFIDSEHFVATYYDPVDYHSCMALFTYVKPEDIQDKKVLVYAGIWVNSDVKSQIIRFNKKSTDYRITIVNYDKYNSDDDYTAGYTKLNNDLIAGNIPDIIQLDGSMPVESYVSKGLLADIDKMIQADPELSKQDYMENVFDAFRVNGVLYRVVPSFNVRTWIGKKSLVGDRTSWTMADVKQVANKLVGDKSIFGLGMTRESFMDDIMDYCGHDFVDVNTGKCSFDSQNFIDLLEYAKTLPTNEDSEKGYDDEYWEHYWENYQSQYRENRSLLMELYLSDVYNIKYNVNGMMGEEVSFIGFPTESGSGSFVDADVTFAISAKSDNQDGAWEFLKFFLSEEYQVNADNKYGYRSGFPILKKMVREQVNQTTERSYWTDENGEKVYYDDTFWINNEEFKIQPFTQAQADEVFNFICSVKNSSYRDENIAKIISEEVQAFYSGSKSAKDAANMIQNRAQLYVNENR